MEFDRMEVWALRGFSEQPITLNLKDQGIVLVEGENRDWGGVARSNWVGKSLLIREAPLWCLTGDTARYGGKTPADAMLHPKRGADVSMWVDGLEVRRTKKPGAKTILAVTSAAGEPVVLSRDQHVREEDLTRILGFDYPMLIASVFMGAETSMADAGFATQMEILESLLRVIEVSAAQEAAAKDRTSLDAQMSTAAMELRLRKLSWEEAQSVLTRESMTARATDDVEAVKLSLSDAQQSAALLPSLQNDAVVAGQREEQCRLAVQAADVAVEKIAGPLREIDASKGNCPTCGRPLKTATHIAVMNKRAVKLRKELRDEEKVKARALIDAQQATTAHRDALERWRAVRESAAAVPHLQARLEQYEREVREREERITEASKRVEVSKQAKDDAALVVESLQARLWRAVSWSTWFGRDELQAQLFSTGMPILNEWARYYSHRITNGHIQVSFSPFRDKQTETLIRLAGTSAPTYKGCSRSEKERINLVLAFSLRKLARMRLKSPINLSVLDESLDGIDDTGIEVISQILQEEVAERGTIFIVTHNQTLRRHFPGSKVLRIIREGGESRVEATA